MVIGEQQRSRLLDSLELAAAFVEMLVAFCAAHGHAGATAALMVYDLDAHDSPFGAHLQRLLAERLPRARYERLCMAQLAVSAPPGATASVGPVAVIARGVLGAMRQQLFGVEDGELFVARTSQQATTEGAEADARCVWRLVPDSDALDNDVREVLDDYRRFLCDGARLVPTDPMRCIAALQRAFAGPTLMLSADCALVRLDQLQSLAFEAIECLPRPWPVNYHALGKRVEARHGDVMFSPAPMGGLTLASWTWPASSSARALRDVHRRCLDHLALADAVGSWAGASLGANAQAAQLLIDLQAHGWHLDGCAPSLSALVSGCDALEPELRAALVDGLHRTWLRIGPCVPNLGIVSDLGLLAARLHAWGLARACFERALTLECDGIDAAHTRYRLAVCLRALGELDGAATHARRAWVEAAGEVELAELCRQLVSTVDEQMSQLPSWYCAYALREDGLSLQPVHPQHADAWAQQTRDGSIPALTRIPPVVSTASAWGFLVERMNRLQLPPVGTHPQKLTFAIVERGHGLVGSVTLVRYQGAAFFSYWVGTDYQGRGLGAAAVRLLCARLLPRLGIGELFTAVFPENPRSRRALCALAWQRLPYRGWAADGRVEYMRFQAASGRSRAREAVRTRLERLLAAIGTDLTVEPHRDSHLLSAEMTAVEQRTWT